MIFLDVATSAEGFLTRSRSDGASNYADGTDSKGGIIYGGRSRARVKIWRLLRASYEDGNDNRQHN
ncbi:MAG: hypothetical protein ACC656_08660 [Candidatus Heimdallarchaeota archaeon]